jgi:hypothetical protein
MAADWLVRGTLVVVVMTVVLPARIGRRECARGDYTEDARVQRWAVLRDCWQPPWICARGGVQGPQDEFRRISLNSYC